MSSSAPLSTNGNLAIRVSNLSKCYKIFARPQDRLMQMLNRGRKKLYREFWSVRDISFEVERGTTVGILGRNGAGKSTLLQLICGTLSATEGDVQVVGRISALLELGTGFNPEFTGRENIFLNASILGLSHQEIVDRYDEIVAFADIGDFLEQPVKTYSSGMFIRLAFGVAVHVDPEILIVDEALSVGDVKFQAKCFRKFEEFRRLGKTILLVSHSPEEIVRHCSKALLIEGGKLIAQGDPKTVTNKYLDIMFGVTPKEKEPTPQEQSTVQGASTISESAQVTSPSSDASQLPSPRVTIGPAPSGECSDTIKANLNDPSVQEFIRLQVFGDNAKLRPGYNKSEYRWGNKEAEIIDYLFCSNTRFHVNHFDASELVHLYIKVKFHQDIHRPVYGLTIKTPDGITVYGTNSRDWNGKEQYSRQSKGDIVVIRFSLIPNLISGHYIISLGVVAISDKEEIVPMDRRYDILETYISNKRKSFGLADLGMTVANVA